MVPPRIGASYSTRCSLNAATRFDAERALVLARNTFAIEAEALMVAPEATDDFGLTVYRK